MLTVLAGGGCEGIHKNIYCSHQLGVKVGVHTNGDTEQFIKESSSSSNKHNSLSKKGWYYGVDSGSRTSLKGRGGSLQAVIGDLGYFALCKYKGPSDLSMSLSS